MLMCVNNSLCFLWWVRFDLSLPGDPWGLWLPQGAGTFRIFFLLQLIIYRSLWSQVHRYSASSITRSSSSEGGQRWGKGPRPTCPRRNIFQKKHKCHKVMNFLLTEPTNDQARHLLEGKPTVCRVVNQTKPKTHDDENSVCLSSLICLLQWSLYWSNCIRLKLVGRTIIAF